MNRTITLQDWFDAYAYDYRATKNHSQYADIRLSALQANIISKYPNLILTDFSEDHLLNCFRSMNKNKISYTGQLAAWSEDMFRECVRCGEIEKNPSEKIIFLPTIIESGQS